MEPFLVIIAAIETIALLGLGYYFSKENRALNEREKNIARKAEELAASERILEPDKAANDSQVRQLPAEKPEEEEAVENDEGPTSLQNRLEALGFEYSAPLTSGEVRCMDDDVLPSCVLDEDDNDADASCGRCCEEELRCVFAGTSKLIEGHLGNYCFSCGYGQYANQDAPPDSRVGDNLFLLLKQWESVSQTTAKTPVANPIPSDPPPPLNDRSST